MLTFQTMIETVLESDGITKEMVKAQQDKLNLIQRLANASSDEVMAEMVQQEDALIDQEFFAILSSVSNNAAGGGNQGLAQRLNEVQNVVIEASTYGVEVKAQSQIVEGVMASLQDLGEDISREKILDLIMDSDGGDITMQAFVSFIRPAMDYDFFNLLSEKLDELTGEEKEHLTAIREKLLELTRVYDEQAQAQAAQAKAAVDAALAAESFEEFLSQNAGLVDELFIRTLQSELEAARQGGDLERGGKLQTMLDTLQNLSTPPEVQLVNQLISIPEAEQRAKMLESLPPESVAQLAEMMPNVVNQVEQGDDLDLVAQVRIVYREVLKYSMKLQMQS
jgi:hypothetical protein